MKTIIESRSLPQPGSSLPNGALLAPVMGNSTNRLELRSILQEASTLQMKETIESRSSLQRESLYPNGVLLAPATGNLTVRPVLRLILQERYMRNLSIILRQFSKIVYCRSPFGIFSGGLIQTASGSGSGTGIPLVNLSGCC